MKGILLYYFAFVCGVIAAAYLSVLPRLAWLVICLIIGLSWLIFCALGTDTHKHRYITMLTALCVFICSLCIAAIHGHYLLAQQFDDNKIARQCLLEGVVTGIPKSAPRYIRFNLSVNHAVCAEHTIDLANVALSVYQTDVLIKAGDWLLAEVKLKSLRSHYSHGSFDTQLWAINNNINATGYVTTIQQHRPNYSSFKGIRHSLKRWLDARDISTVAKASLHALVLGDKSAINQAQWQAMRITGTVHLLVVSGLHVGIMLAIGWWLFFCLRSALYWLKFPWPIGYLPALGGLSLSFAYVLLAGASLSTLRAWLMALVLIAGHWLSVKPALWQRWWWALIIIISWQPLSVVQPGLWLSFIAVASLICLQGYRTSTGKWRLLVKSQLSVWLALLPLLLVYFQQISLISPLVNIVAISFISCLLVLLLPVLMLSVYAIQWPLTLLATSLDYFWLFLTKIALAASALVLQVDSLPNTLVVLIAASCLVLMLPFSSRLKIISAFACLIIFFPPLQTKPEKDQFTLHLLDVGQGLSIFIETHTRNILFDTGAGYASGFNYFNAIIQPLLSKIKVHKLDLMVISHSDNDHSGGLLAAQSALKIARLDSEIAGDGSVVNKPCESNLAWQWDGVSFHYRHPDVSSEKKINNRSCVLEISTQQCKVLIMADAEKKIEALLIPTNIQANQQVLIVGHHGSNTSTSKDFLQREAFTSALISNGYKNRYGHPHPSVLKRLHQAEVEIYRTDVLGSIEVTAGVSGCDISSYKQKNKRYWW